MAMRWTIVAAAFAAVSAPVLAQDAKVQFEARYAELRSAMAAHDDAAIAAITTPDYAMTDLNGETHTRDQMKQMGGRMGARVGGGRGGAAATRAPTSPAAPTGAAQTAPPAPPRPERQITQSVLSAAVNGPVATVELQTTMNGSRAGDDGKPHTMEMTAKSTDTWVKAGDAWQLKASVQKSMSVKRDGEVVFSQG